MPAIYDPGHDAPGRGGGTTRDPFPGNTIPHGPHGPGRARTLLERYPLPNRAGHGQQLPARRRTRTTTRISSTCASIIGSSTRDQVFGRLTLVPRRVLPVTPLPDGSGTLTTGTLGPQDTASWSFASSYQRTFFGPRLSTSCASATRGARSDRTAAAAATARRPRPWACPAFRRPRSFPKHAADVPHRRLPAARIARRTPASDFGTSVTQIADTLTWVQGPAHAQGRRRLALGAAQRRPAAVADRARSRSPACSPTCPAPPTPARRSPASCSARSRASRSTCSRSEIRNRAPLPGVLRPGRLAASRSRLTVNAGLRYTLNFPSTETDDQTAVFNLDDPAARVRGPGRPPARGPGAAQGQLRPAPRRRLPARPTKTVVRVGLRAGLDRDGRHHDAVHDAGVPVPPDRRRSARSTTSARPSCWPAARRVAPIALDAGRRPRPGRLRRRPRPRLGLRAAVERSPCSASSAPTSPSRWPTSGRRSRTSAFPTRTSIS